MRPSLSPGSAETGGEEKMRGVSLNAFLTRLIWLCVLPLVVFAVYLSVIHVLTLQDQHDQEAANLARNVATSIDRYIGAHISALQMLASSPLMDDPCRLEEFFDEATGFRETFGGEVVLVDLSAQMIFNTRVPFGSPQPKLPVPRGRAAVPTVMATGSPAVGDMFVGPDSRQSLVASAVPLVRSGNVKFILVNIVEVGEIGQSLDEVALPAGWSLTVLDGNGEIMARRSPPELERYPDDEESTGRFSAKCTGSNWSVVLDVPRDVYHKPIVAAAAALAAAVLFLTLFSVLGGRMAGRQLARSVAALAEMPSCNASYLLISEIEKVRKLLNESAAARRAAELTRLESEQRFRQLFDIAPIPLCFFNKDGVLINLNARFEQTFGYDHQDAYNMSEWLLRASPDPEYRRWALDTWEATVRRARENGTDIEPMEYRITCKDGRVLTVVSSGTIIGDDFLATFFDITERKQAEEALVLERNKFRRFLDSLPVGVYIANDHCQIEYVNPVMQCEFGPTEGRKCHDYFHGRNEVCPWCKNAQVVSGNTVRWEWYGEGTKKTYDRIATPVHNADGSISKLEVFLDITARKKAEKALRQWADAFEYCAHGIEIHLPTKNRILVCNPAFARMHRMTPEEVAGFPILNFYAAPEHEYVRECILEADRVGQVRYETVMKRKDGSTFPAQMDLVSVRDAEGNLLYRVATMQDITERNESVAALRDSLEEKVALLKEVHHRVKNNLQVVASLLGLQASRSGNQQVVDILRDTRNRVKSMAMLHEALYRSENLARINFANYMKDLCGQLILSFGPVTARVKLENRIARIALPLEHAVPCGLIASELVSNAFKHGFPGERTGRIIVGLEPVQGQLVLSVSDDGVGLSPGWDPSDTSTLGLQLVSRLASQLGGKLESTRSQGRGAVFHVTFPVPENTVFEGDL